MQTYPVMPFSRPRVLCFIASYLFFLTLTPWAFCSFFLFLPPLAGSPAAPGITNPKNNIKQIYMKKFLLSAAALLFTLGASAQAFTVTANGNPVENGATVYCDHFNSDMEQIEPEVMVTPNDDCTLYVDLYNTGETNVQMCFPMNCQFVKPGNTLSVNGDLTAGVARNLMIDAMTMGVDPFDASCEITMYLDGDEDNTFEFTLNMHYDSSSVDEIGAADNAPAVYYNLQGVEVANPENGIFIRRQGNKVTKVAL